MRKIILCCSMLVLLNSCAFIHFMGTKHPSDRTKEETEIYLKKNKFDFYDYSFLYPDEKNDSLSQAKYAINTWKSERGTAASPIQLHIYDSRGDLQNAHSQCFGDMNKLNILSEKEYKNFDWLPINYDLKLIDHLDLLDLDQTTKEELLEKAFQKEDVYLVYWNIWSNHYSKIMFRKMKKYFKEFPDKRKEVLIILVNTDFTPLSGD